MLFKKNTAIPKVKPVFAAGEKVILTVDLFSGADMFPAGTEYTIMTFHYDKYGELLYDLRCGESWVRMNQGTLIAVVQTDDTVDEEQEKDASMDLGDLLSVIFIVGFIALIIITSNS